MQKFGLTIKMTLNPNYETIGKAFTEQYYKLFDDPALRPQLVNLYNVRIHTYFASYPDPRPWS